MVLTRKRRAIEAQNAVASTSGIANSTTLNDGVASGLSREDPDALLALPFDILLEVLNQVKPRDLLHLSRLNKAWRVTMRGGNVNSRAVWTMKRRESKIPEPPTGVTEPQWASLWFENFCQSCGICNGKIDWALFKRVCGGCKSTHIVSRSQYKKRPNSSEEYLDYVPSILRGSTEGYWDEDIHKVAQLFSQLDQSALEAWKTKRVAALEERKASRNAMVRAYDAWKTEIKRVARVEMNQRRVAETRRNFERCKAKFKEMGYEDVDIDPVMTAENPQVAPYLKDISYSVYFVSDFQRRFERDVKYRRDARVVPGMGPLIAERMNIFKAWYYAEALPKILPPISQMSYPQAEEFRSFSQLERILEQDRDRLMTTKDLDTLVLPKLKYWVEGSWRWDLTQSLIHVLPYVSYGPHNIGLARHVFKRCEHSTPAPANDTILLGWSMIQSHQCTTPTRETDMHRGFLRVKMPCLFSYNSAPSKVAELLIGLAGLEVASATVENMEARDARFVVASHVKDGGYPILSWRAAIVVMYTLRSDECRLATDEEEKAAKEAEPALRDVVRAWACNHCHKFLETSEAQTKPFIVQHLKEEHDIAEPQLKADFFVNERRRHAYEAASYIVM